MKTGAFITFRFGLGQDKNGWCDDESEIEILEHFWVLSFKLESIQRRSKTDAFGEKGGKFEMFFKKFQRLEFEFGLWRVRNKDEMSSILGLILSQVQWIAYWALDTNWRSPKRIYTKFLPGKRIIKLI